jgi:hypothetical protein
MVRWFVILFVSFLGIKVQGQICCTAGTPITGNFNLTTLEKGQFSFINATLDTNEGKYRIDL